MSRIYNFSAGPSTLPVEALEEVRDQLLDFNGLGMSVIEMSHRSKPIIEVHEAALQLFRDLVGLSDDYEVMFLGGGATMQFAMLPMNLLAGGKSCDFVHSGAWAKKALADAKKLGNVNVLFDGADSNYATLPDPSSLRSTEGATYLHLTSNETIGGIQWKEFPNVDAPLVSDMSSDILSRPLPVEKFGVIYAGAQKNIGPAGLAVTIMRKDLLESCPDDLPNYLSYKNHAAAGSMLNTPPVFAIYMVKLILERLKASGGVEKAQQVAAERAGLIYDTMDNSGGYYSTPVGKDIRSDMNVVFRLPSEDLEARFVKEAAAQGLSGLKGHRSVGGCRASIYNAMPMEGAKALADFMGDFAQKNG
ncbi:MAG: 3-phosphoserine/phosphohydroxythreonine transaminase [Planctomycetota bacterium]|jgi:phosphoserine aminotransferase